ncbi:hypothetical protein [Tenacibaculum ascidiaceicola]|uniref:hypothetical protein n=1 Tax=Tenacibaculum ascidiaceicola TaxID=1699411 RepID=UPI003CE487EE
MKKQILELGKRLEKEVQQKITGGYDQNECPPGQIKSISTGKCVKDKGIIVKKE